MIDSHRHYWRYDPLEYDWIDESMGQLRRDFLPSHQPESGVDGIVAVQARQSIDETNFLLELASDPSARIEGVVGWLDLVLPDFEESLARYEGTKLFGLRHILQAEPDDAYMLRPEFIRGLSTLAASNFTYDLLIFPRHLPFACELVDRLPSLTFVVDHLAKPQIARGGLSAWKGEIAELAKRPNVCAKLSGLVIEANWESWQIDDLKPYFESALHAFGPDRLMFGSDWPVCLVASTFERWQSTVARLIDGLTKSEQHSILSETARRAYRLRA